MNFDLSTILVIAFIAIYLIFGLQAGYRFLMNHWGDKFQDPKRAWLKYLLAAILGIPFGYAYFFIYILKAIIKLVQFITSGRIGS